MFAELGQDPRLRAAQGVVAEMLLAAVELKQKLARTQAGWGKAAGD